MGLDFLDEWFLSQGKTVPPLQTSSTIPKETCVIETPLTVIRERGSESALPATWAATSRTKIYAINIYIYPILYLFTIPVSLNYAAPAIRSIGCASVCVCAKNILSAKNFQFHFSKFSKRASE